MWWLAQDPKDCRRSKIRNPSYAERVQAREDLKTIPFSQGLFDAERGQYDGEGEGPLTCP
eukprot:4880863-Pyramimonas_sp.AAC.1